MFVQTKNNEVCCACNALLDAIGAVGFLFICEKYVDFG